MFFNTEGYEVLEAENGQSALKILTDCPEGRLPDCIILDLMMPVMDGGCFLNYIEDHHKNTFGKIPVCIISGFGSFPHTDQIKGFFQKPFSMDSVLSTIQNLALQKSA